MKKNILARTNTLICLVIAAGFLLTAVLSYRANYSSSIENIEQISTLTSEGIYYQLNNTFTKPVNVSLTMANDSFLKDFLIQESRHLSDKEYVETIKRFLAGYQTKYDYDSVFLVSSESGRYYNYNGLDRVLTEGGEENSWYYNFLSGDAEYSMNVDNDEVVGAKDAITVFVNCKIKNDIGDVIGVVGVGLRIDYLQALLADYQNKFKVEAYLVNEEGIIELSPEHTGYAAVSLSEANPYGEQKLKEIMDWKEEGLAKSFWAGENGKHGKSFLVSRYLPELEWHLIVESDTRTLMSSLNRQLVFTMLIILGIVLLILFIITYVIRSFNKRIVELIQCGEQERKTMFEQATGELYEEIYELDITNNRPANRVTAEYFESLGAPAGISYDKALRIVANKQIKEEFREEYIETFLTENVLRAFADGQDTLRYDFQILNECGQYYWMRITARIMRWSSDGSVHMLTYRQNINEEKEQERRMEELAHTDEMTGFLTKTATTRQTMQELEKNPSDLYGFFIFDIDHFKEANDICGHAFGDSVIVSVTQMIRQHFRKNDILGRIGGDEFAAFVPLPDEDWARYKAEELSVVLSQVHHIDGKEWKLTVSIGVAVMRNKDFETLYKSADEALYVSKKNGRNRFTIYSELMENKQSEITD